MPTFRSRYRQLRAHGPDGQVVVFTDGVATTTHPGMVAYLRGLHFVTEDSAGTSAAPRARPAPPPRYGRGSSAAAWRDWATQAGVTVDDDASRDDVIAAAIRAGVLTDDE